MTDTVTNVTTLPNVFYYASPSGTPVSANGLVAISNSGEIVGSSNGATNNNAAAWHGLAVTGLGALPGYAYSIADGVNDLGQVVGYSAADLAELSHATLWQNGTAVAIGDPTAASVANGINDSGQVVGEIGAVDAPGHAYLWQNGILTYLQELPGIANTDSGAYDSEAYAINNSGQIVGTVLDSQGTDHGALWQHGVLTDLGDPYGNTVAVAINASGEAVGRSGYYAMAWQNGTAIKLATLQGTGLVPISSEADGINDAGIIVGSSSGYDSGGHAFTVATIWVNGVAIDLNTLVPASAKTGTLAWASAINDSGQILASNNGGTFVVTLDGSILPQSAASATQAFAAGTLSAPAAIQDSGTDVQQALDQLQILAAAGKIASITLTDSTAPALTVSPTQLLHDAAVLQDISSAYTLSVTGPIAAAALTSTSGEHLTSVTIVDSAADIAANLPNIEGVADGGGLKAIQLTDSGSPTLTLPEYQLADAKALAAITGPYHLALIDVDPQNVLADAAKTNVVSLAVTVDDFVAGGYLDSLQTVAAEGKLASITLHPGFSLSNSANTPTLVLSAPQVTTDTGALAKIAGDYNVQITTSATASQVVQGIAGHANEVVFNGTAASYGFTDNGGTVTVSGNGLADTVSGVQELTFSDHSLFVAQMPSSTAATSGNITELYAAVFGREPDLAGLAYYEAVLAAAPSTPLSDFALKFLASPEYVNNTAHNYAQNPAGDAQFVTDTYNNLLHRAPGSGEVAWYQANVINQILGGATPGTAAYTAAEAQAHAQLLVDFSASPEFLADVQVTTQHPADAQHWLVLT